MARSGARQAPARKARQSQGAHSEQPDRARHWVVPVVFVAILAVVLAVALPLLLDSGDDAGSSSAGSDPGVAHVHGLGIDPKDKMLYAATHYGVFRIPASGTATRVADRFQDTMGFTVVGPGHFLGSGHPDPREDKPSRLGLIESTDAGQTWQSLSLEGEADFHVLAAAHGRVYGFDAASSKFMVSTDRRTWEPRGLTPLVDFAVSPIGADAILGTLEDGLARSSDGGRSFAVVKGAPPVMLVAWPAADLVLGVTVTGAVMASTDGGASWEQRGSLDGRPQALIADDNLTVHAATETGIYTSTDGGRSFQLRYRG